MFKSILPSAAAAVALLLVPVAAGAHTKLVGSTPAANSTVSKVVSVNLQFNEKVIASTLKTELVMTGMPGMANHAPMKVPYSSMMGKEGKSTDAHAQAAADARHLQGQMVGGGRRHPSDGQRVQLHRKVRRWATPS